MDYQFNGDVITATLKEPTGEIDAKGNEVFNETSETFDFSAMPDGEATEIIPETLPIKPIKKAKRVAGVLEVELLHYHGPNATEAERYPDWMEV